MGKKRMMLDTREGGIVTFVEKESDKDTYKVVTTAGDYAKVGVEFPTWLTVRSRSSSSAVDIQGLLNR